MRECYCCGSTKTYVDKKSGTPTWLSNKIEDQWLCVRCYNRLIIAYKWAPIQNPVKNKRRINFRGRRILIKTNPRTGYCTLCSNNIHNGTCERTAIHHLEYHVENPLQNTIEVCTKCHVLITKGKLLVHY